jgi:Tol biopolymer transport system component
VRQQLKAIALMIAAVSFSSEIALATTEPPAPQLFAPGVISGPQNDGAPTFLPDGRTLFFERSYAHRSVIFEAHLIGTEWSTPQVASFSGPWSDQQPALASDGSYLIYASARRRPTSTPNGKAVGYNHLWRVDRAASGWSAPVELPPEVNISDLVFKPSIAANGDLYFMSAEGSDANGPKWRLYYAIKTATGYAHAERLPFSDGNATDVDPFIAPDGSYLVFSSKGRRTPDDGNEHLFLAIRSKGAWGAVQPLRYAGDDWGADDGEAQVSPDGQRLYFTSARSAPVNRTETRQALLEDIRKAEQWDNGNTNAWWLPLPQLFKSNGVALAP